MFEEQQVTYLFDTQRTSKKMIMHRTSTQRTISKFLEDVIIDGLQKSVDSDGVYYSIKSVDDINILANYVSDGHTCEGARFKVENDIDLDSGDNIPIGSLLKTRFKGIFDGGKDYVISNMHNQLFDAIEAPAVIQNLKLSNPTISFTNGVFNVPNTTLKNNYYYYTNDEIEKKDFDPGMTRLCRVQFPENFARAVGMANDSTYDDIINIGNETLFVKNTDIYYNLFDSSNSGLGVVKEVNGSPRQENGYFFLHIDDDIVLNITAFEEDQLIVNFDTHRINQVSGTVIKDEQIISHMKLDDLSFTDWNPYIKWNIYNPKKCSVKNNSLNENSWEAQNSQKVYVDKDKAYIYTYDIDNEDNVHIRFWINFHSLSTNFCILNYKNLVKIYSNRLVCNLENEKFNEEPSYVEEKEDTVVFEFKNYIMDPISHIYNNNGELLYNTYNIKLHEWYLFNLDLITIDEENDQHMLHFTIQDRISNNEIIKIAKLYSNINIISKVSSEVALGALTRTDAYFEIKGFAAYLANYSSSHYNYPDEYFTDINNRPSPELTEEEIQYIQNKEYPLNNYLASYLNFNTNTGFCDDYKDNVYWSRHNVKYLNPSKDGTGKYNLALCVNKPENAYDTYLQTYSIKNLNLATEDYPNNYKFTIRFWIYFEEMDPNICILDYKGFLQVYCDKIKLFDDYLAKNINLETNKWYFITISPYIKNTSDCSLDAIVQTEENIIYDKETTNSTFVLDGNPFDVSKYDNNPVKLGAMGTGSVKYYIDDFGIFKNKVSGKELNIDKIGKNIILSNVLQKETKLVNEETCSDVYKNSLISYLEFNNNFSDYNKNIKWKGVNIFDSNTDFDSLFVEEQARFTKALCIDAKNNQKYIFTDSIKDSIADIHFWIYFEKMDPNVCIFNFKNILKLYCNRFVFYSDDNSEPYESEWNFKVDIWYMFSCSISRNILDDGSMVYAFTMGATDYSKIISGDYEPYDPYRYLTKQNYTNIGNPVKQLGSHITLDYSKILDKSGELVQLGAIDKGTIKFYIDDFYILSDSPNIPIRFNEKSIENSCLRDILNQNAVTWKSLLPIAIEKLQDHLDTYLNFDIEYYYEHIDSLDWRTSENSLNNFSSQFKRKYNGAQCFDTSNSENKVSYLYTTSEPRTKNIQIRFWIYFDPRVDSFGNPLPMESYSSDDPSDPDNVCILNYKDIFKFYKNRIEVPSQNLTKSFDISEGYWYYVKIDLLYLNDKFEISCNLEPSHDINNNQTSSISSKSEILNEKYTGNFSYPKLNNKELLKLGITTPGKIKFYIDDFMIFHRDENPDPSEIEFNIDNYISEDTNVIDLLPKPYWKRGYYTKDSLSINDYLVSYLPLNSNIQDYKLNVVWKEKNKDNPSYSSNIIYKDTNGSRHFKTEGNEYKYISTTDIKDTNGYIRFWIYFEEANPEVCILNYKDIIKVYYDRIEGYERTCFIYPELKLNKWYLFKIKLSYNSQGIIWSCYISE